MPSCSPLNCVWTIIRTQDCCLSDDLIACLCLTVTSDEVLERAQGCSVAVCPFCHFGSLCIMSKLSTRTFF